MRLLSLLLMFLLTFGGGPLSACVASAGGAPVPTEEDSATEEKCAVGQEASMSQHRPRRVRHAPPVAATRSTHGLRPASAPQVFGAAAFHGTLNSPLTC